MPFVDGRTRRGWGVFSPTPWNFAGLFSSKPEAEREAARLGSNYLVRLGDNREGTDDFVWTTLNNQYPGP